MCTVNIATKSCSHLNRACFQEEESSRTHVNSGKVTGMYASGLQKDVGETVGLTECHQCIRGHEVPLWSDARPGEKHGYAHLTGLHATVVHSMSGVTKSGCPTVFAFPVYFFFLKLDSS